MNEAVTAPPWEPFYNQIPPVLVEEGAGGRASDSPVTDALFHEALASVRDRLPNNDGHMAHQLVDAFVRFRTMTAVGGVLFLIRQSPNEDRP